MTALITFICLLITLALFAGAFYLSHYVVSLQHRANVLEDTYKEAIAHIDEQEKVIVQLQQEIDFIRRESEMHSTRGERMRTWNPGDPLNSGGRL